MDNYNNNTPILLNQNNRLGVTFSGNFMKQSKIGYAHGNVENIYIAYELKIIRINSPDFTAQNALFGAVKITKDVDTSNYKYSGYGICFDGESDFTSGNITNGKNVLIFDCDMSFSSHANNKVNNIYVLGKDFVQGINGTTMQKILINIILQNQTKSLYLVYIKMGMILIYLLMEVKS